MTSNEQSLFDKFFSRKNKKKDQNNNQGSVSPDNSSLSTNSVVSYDFPKSIASNNDQSKLLKINKNQPKTNTNSNINNNRFSLQPLPPKSPNTTQRFDDSSIIYNNQQNQRPQTKVNSNAIYNLIGSPLANPFANDITVLNNDLSNNQMDFNILSD